MTKHAILAIDQGTTSTRAMVFGLEGQVHARAQEEFTQHYPGDAHVEHDPEDIWNTTVDTVREALAEASAKGVDVAGIGITNQRETVLVWDRKTGEPIHRAIVWQDRRTADVCARLLREDAEDDVRARTGLIIDPYFSATKIAWLLDHVEGARAKAEAGELACGTVDSFLIWRLTGGKVHATDVTNASRTSLFNIRTGAWDDELLRLFDVPRAVLPEVRDCAADFGETYEALFGRAIPIRGVAGDQQAAAIGQACFEPGALKSTYGTGCFALMNTGPAILESKSRLLSTVAYSLSGKMTYAVEGSIFIAGAAVQWLRDGLGLLASSEETEERAARAAADARVVMVPAFTGMGAPHWLPEARAAVFGMTRATGKDELARAALEGVVYQTHDLFAAMAKDGLTPQRLRVDGGMVANDWFVQRLADVLALEVDRPEVLETTALGAAYLAALGLGEFSSLDEVAANWKLERNFSPGMAETERQERLARWTACCEAVIAVARAEAKLKA